MHVLAILGQKGGNGKTTTALGLAVAASLAGRDVAVVGISAASACRLLKSHRLPQNPAAGL